MNNVGSIWLVCFLVLVASTTATGTEVPPLQIAKLGDLKLESGAVLHDAKVGYRTLGTLNAAKSNAILFPSYFTGTSADLCEDGSLEPLDTKKFFIIVVDSLGNGISSSPSNTKPFPTITIRDMVNAEHRLVTEALGLAHLHAVMGISMGGMQAFEWMVAHPTFMNKAIPIAGSPRLASYDALLWQTQIEAIEVARAGGDETRASKLVGMISMLAFQTPRYHARKSPWGKREELIQSAMSFGTGDIADREAQLRAMLAHDVSRHFGGSMEKAAAAVKAQVLSVVGLTDHMVTPEPAMRFAELLGADSLELMNDCGHIANTCDGGQSTEAIRRFLE